MSLISNFCMLYMHSTSHILVLPELLPVFTNHSRYLGNDIKVQNWLIACAIRPHKVNF